MALRLCLCKHLWDMSPATKNNSGSLPETNEGKIWSMQCYLQVFMLCLCWVHFHVNIHWVGNPQMDASTPTNLLAGTFFLKGNPAVVSSVHAVTCCSGQLGLKCKGGLAPEN